MRVRICLASVHTFRVAGIRSVQAWLCKWLLWLEGRDVVAGCACLSAACLCVCVCPCVHGGGIACFFSCWTVEVTWMRGALRDRAGATHLLLVAPALCVVDLFRQGEAEEGGETGGVQGKITG